MPPRLVSDPREGTRHGCSRWRCRLAEGFRGAAAVDVLCETEAISQGCKPGSFWRQGGGAEGRLGAGSLPCCTRCCARQKVRHCGLRAKCRDDVRAWLVFLCGVYRQLVSGLAMSGHPRQMGAQRMDANNFMDVFYYLCGSAGLCSCANALGN